MPTVSLMGGNFNTMGGNFDILPRAGKRNTAWCYVAVFLLTCQKVASLGNVAMGLISNSRMLRLTSFLRGSELSNEQSNGLLRHLRSPVRCSWPP